VVSQIESRPIFVETFKGAVCPDRIPIDGSVTSNSETIPLWMAALEIL
jgi:hypothetical protein